MLNNTRLTRKFDQLKTYNKGALSVFMTAGYPNYDASLELLKGLPKNGVQTIELGIPFTDPPADGPAIQLASQKALENGMTVAKTLQMVKEFRKEDKETPIVLMGYYNPIHKYGKDDFAKDAKAAGADALLIADLPPEQSDEYHPELEKNGLHLICLATPATNNERLKYVLKNASGFLYYVSILGVTGSKNAVRDEVADAMQRMKQHTDLPVAVGFGIKTPEQVGEIAELADLTVVGSAVVQKLSDTLKAYENNSDKAVKATLQFVADLADGIK
ncbi:MAG: tryptophan synthase subunit alpha [Alphaproteobacteria bacterium]|nr:tryptophan synthase subunit alpha [Alphaproteobacteria bacterium]